MRLDDTAPGFPDAGQSGWKALSRPDKWFVLISLLAVSGIAWLYLLMMFWHMQTMPMAQMWMPPTGLDARPWAPLDFWLTFLMWAVMMMAMMVPSAFPMVMMFTAINRRKRAASQPYVSTWVFIAGYVIAWAGFSALAALAQWPMHRYALLTPMMDNSSHVLAGIALVVAGLYQFTPWKDVCLNKCRTPLGFVMTQWRDGTGGALAMGLRHGLYCVGCCWALMLVLFAVGVMNMLWVVIITAFVIFEKVMPGGPKAVRFVSGSLLLAWGMWLLVGATT
ncbi:MAG: DUF2182 domain-containing protein [Gammaproteobacteria bacterium]|nr:DUF2182 domain-containing protein [Gammaproteobacteria bacterium]